MSGAMAWFDALLDLVLSPALWLGVTIAAACSVVFYGWRGGGLRQLGRDLVAGLVGFGLGQLAGTWLGFDWLRVGQVQVLLGAGGALVALLVGRSIWRPGSRRR